MGFVFYEPFDRVLNGRGVYENQIGFVRKKNRRWLGTGDPSLLSSPLRPPAPFPSVRNRTVMRVRNRKQGERNYVYIYFNASIFLTRLRTYRVKLYNTPRLTKRLTIVLHI